MSRTSDFSFKNALTKNLMEYNDNQERDDHGRWTDGGGSSSGSSSGDAKSKDWKTAPIGTGTAAARKYAKKDEMMANLSKEKDPPKSLSKEGAAGVYVQKAREFAQKQRDSGASASEVKAAVEKKFPHLHHAEQLHASQRSDTLKTRRNNAEYSSGVKVSSQDKKEASNSPKDRADAKHAAYEKGVTVSAQDRADKAGSGSGADKKFLGKYNAEASVANQHAAMRAEVKANKDPNRLVTKDPAYHEYQAAKAERVRTQGSQAGPKNPKNSDEYVQQYNDRVEHLYNQVPFNLPFKQRQKEFDKIDAQVKQEFPEIKYALKTRKK